MSGFWARYMKTKAGHLLARTVGYASALADSVFVLRFFDSGKFILFSTLHNSVFNIVRNYTKKMIRYTLPTNYQSYEYYGIVTQLFHIHVLFCYLSSSILF